MRLFLVQHAEAVSKQDDPTRPLTKSGREDMLLTVEMAAALGIQLEEIWHSGKLRAIQTAEIIANKLPPIKGLKKQENLGPLDPIQPIVKKLDLISQPILLVGHLPFLEKLTGWFVAGDEELRIVAFRNAAIVCLDKEVGRWHLSWIFTPEMARLRAS